MKLTRVEPVKILIVHSTLHIGGAEEVTANLCRHIDRTRFDVKVCVLKENGIIGKKIEEEGTEVLVVPHHRSYKIDYFTSLKLRKIIIKNDIKLVHSHDVHAFTDCSLCKLTVSGLKLVHTFHYGNYPEREKKLRRLERLLWRVPDQLVSVSKKQKKGLQKLYGIPENRIKTLWNGVDLKVGSCTVQEINAYHKKGRIIIGSINTLIEQKGMEDLIEVARVLKQKATNDFVFIVAGDGPLRDELDKQLRDYGLEEHVIFLGWIKDASSVLMPYIDIFFQPSLWEAMSMVLLEAMAAEKPIVATRVGETPMIIQDESNGYLVDPKDITGMIVALERLIVDGNKRNHIGKEARGRYQELFTAEKMARRYEDLYDTICNDHAGRD